MRDGNKEQNEQTPDRESVNEFRKILWGMETHGDRPTPVGGLQV